MYFKKYSHSQAALQDLKNSTYRQMRKWSGRKMTFHSWLVVGYPRAWFSPSLMLSSGDDFPISPVCPVPAKWYGLVFALNVLKPNYVLLSWIFQQSSLCQMLPYWTFLMVSFTSISAPKLPLMDEEQATPLGHLPAPRFSQLHLRTVLILSSHETSCIEPFWTLSSQTLKNFRARAESWTIRSCSCQWRNSWVYPWEYECTIQSTQGQNVPVDKAEGSLILA